MDHYLLSAIHETQSSYREEHGREGGEGNQELINGQDSSTNRNLENKRKASGCFLHEKAKGALIRAPVSTISNIDAPTSFFFSLEQKAKEQNLILHLKLPNGAITSDPAEMRLAVGFYRDLFSAGSWDPDCEEILEGQTAESFSRLQLLL